MAQTVFETYGQSGGDRMSNEPQSETSVAPHEEPVAPLGTEGARGAGGGIRRASPRARTVAWLAAAIVPVMLVAAAVVLVPQWQLDRLNRNESLAIARMKWICTAENHMKAVGAWDPGATGTGGFGFFSDLRGEPSRGNAVLDWGSQPLPLGRDLEVDERGLAHCGGYVFALFLPAQDGGWATERDVVQGRAIDEAKARELWICYAWPEEPGSTGRRVFMIHQSGDLLAHGNADLKYGDKTMPTPGASGFVSNEPGARLVENAIDCVGDLWWIVG